MLSLDSAKLEAMLKFLESQKNTNKKTSLNKTTKQNEKGNKMKIVTLIEYNPITGSLYGYGTKDISDNQIEKLYVFGTLRKYQQINYKNRKLMASYQRTIHK